MLNASYKKEALVGLRAANKSYQEKYEETIKDITTLHNLRLKAVETIKNVEEYISSLANHPKQYDKTLNQISIRRQKFETEIHNLELEGKKTDKVSGTIAGAGAIAGAGIAALGPSAAMAVAMTFGTASTGTAIATLSGAAATNAALAWLGGGAVVAGGAGVAGGEVLLTLAGPVGWAIGGAALFGGGIMANSKNKKIAKKAMASALTIKKETERISETDIRINTLKREIDEIYIQLGALLSNLKSTNIHDYELFNDVQVYDLMKLINITETLSRKIGEVIS